MKVLRKHRIQATEKRLVPGPGWSGTEVEFTSIDDSGRPLNPNRVTRVFQREAQRLGLPKIGVHGLRHGLATAAMQAGTPVKVVSDRLGHSSVAITLDRYTHVSEEDRRRSADIGVQVVGE